MKIKWTAVTLAVISVMFIFSSLAFAAVSNIKLVVNGKAVTSDVPFQVINGRTLGSIDVISKSLGAVIDWDKSTNKLVVNGKGIKSDVPPQIVKGITMVPVRAISESLGATVVWESKTRSVKVNIPIQKVPSQEELSKINPEIGFLAYWHSVPNDPLRRAESARAVAELEKRTGIPGYFVSHMPLSNWYDGVSYLEAKGVKYFIVLYMDDQPTYGSTLTDVLQWMLDLPGGRGVDPSKTPNGWGVEKPHPTDPAKYGNIADYMGGIHIKLKTFSNSVFVLTTTPTDPGPFPLEAFEKQIKAVMKDRANTSIMLVDHGAAVDEVNSRWIQYRQMQADALKTKLGLKRAGAFAIREDWKDLWPKSVENMIATADEWSKDSTVIHVPIRENGLAGGGSSAQIVVELKKGNWVFAPAIMEVKDNQEGLIRWAADTLTRATSWVKTEKPTQNTFFGRTDQGVEGGINVNQQTLTGNQTQANPH